MRRLLAPLAALAIVAGLVVGAYALAGRWLRLHWHPDPAVVARASLDSVREQNRLTPFAARFVAVVTAEEHRFGFSARKTLILPGLVRYEVDLARLRQRDVNWDAATKTLAVTLPPIEIAGPEVDLAASREYGEGGVLLSLTDAEKQLDDANRKAAQAELLTQARDATPLRLARDAARTAVARSFAMPLKAAGIDATVTVRFAGDPAS